MTPLNVVQFSPAATTNRAEKRVFCLKAQWTAPCHWHWVGSKAESSLSSVIFRNFTLTVTVFIWCKVRIKTVMPCLTLQSMHQPNRMFDF